MQKKSNITIPYIKPTVEIDPSRIIFRYKGSPTDEEKVLLRQKYNVTDFKTCSCGDKNLELWGLATTTLLEGETAVRGLRKNDVESGHGQHHFYFPFPEAKDFDRLDCGFSEDVCISGNDDFKVNIAVLDTGFNLGHFNKTPFLYNTSGLGDCPGNVGWNFNGEGSNDVSDDHGHGTYVTKIITETLDKKGIGHRILPLKVLDKEGKGSFWNVLCALSYLQKIQNEGANIHLVNASLGGTLTKQLFNDSDLFNTIVQELESEMLVLTSAGNDGLDTDGLLPTSLRHFSSSYIANNILAVGGYSKDPDDGKLIVDLQSNFGSTSIDLAAPYEIEVADSRVPPLQGTSFSTAYVTALAAEEYYKNYEGNPNPSNIKKALLNSASIENGLNNQIAGNRAIIS